MESTLACVAYIEELTNAGCILSCSVVVVVGGGGGGGGGVVVVAGGVVVVVAAVVVVLDVVEQGPPAGGGAQFGSLRSPTLSRQMGWRLLLRPLLLVGFDSRLAD